MFKILNLILVSALILIVSIACSTTTDDSVSDVEFYTHEQQYNKLLAYTTELEERLSNLEAVVSNDIYILDDETIPQPYEASLIYISGDQIYTNPNAAAIRLITGADILSGCTDFIACNYNPEATMDDGSCDYLDNSSVDLTSGSWVMDADFECDGIFDGPPGDWGRKRQLVELGC